MSRPSKRTRQSEPFTCYCGKEFFVYKKELGKGCNLYCSLECRNNSPARIEKTSATRKKTSEANAVKNKAAKRLRCRRCGELKEKDLFVKDSTRPHGYFPWCKSCHVAKQHDYKKIVSTSGNQTGNKKCLTCLLALSEDAHDNRQYCSSKCKDRAKRWSEFGLTPEEFRKLTESGKCPLCNCSVNRWVIDHNHETGETTGPVCQRCNQYLLAGSKHKVEVAAALLNYLTNPPVRRLFGERRYVGLQATSKIHRMWLWTGETTQ